MASMALHLQSSDNVARVLWLWRPRPTVLPRARRVRARPLRVPRRCLGHRCAHGEAETPSRSPVAPSIARKSGVAIYVYDLPSDLGLAALAFNAYKNGGGETIYLAEWHFLEALLADGAVRTTVADEADLFFVPTFAAQGVSSNFFCPRGQIELIASHLRARSPYWRRSNGRDHVFFVTGDKGACGLPPSVAAHAIFIHHFGLLAPYASMPRSVMASRKMRSARAVVTEMHAAQWCHQPHKDIVVPPLVPRGEDPPPSGADNVRRPWKFLLVHAGGIYGPQGVRQNRQSWHSSRYSQGMRQELYETYPHPRTGGVFVSERRVDENVFLAAKTCLAPTGEGWGIRLSKSVVSGCVPLIAQPWIEQPFETLLQYDAFSLRMGYGEAQALTSQLSDAALPAKTVHEMRRALSPAARALEWRPGLGGLAYNLTVLALCHRAVQLRGSLRAGPGTSCVALAEALLPLVGVDHAGVQRKAARGEPPSWHPAALVNATAHLQARRQEHERRSLEQLQSARVR